MEPEGSLPRWQVPATCPYPESDQSSPCPPPTSWLSILILSSHLRLGLLSDSFPQVSPPKPCKHLSFPHTCYIPHPSHSSLFDHPNIIWWGVQIYMHMQFYKLVRLEVGQMISLFWLCYWAECLPPRISLNASGGKPATAHATRWSLTCILDSLQREVKPLPLSSVPLAVPPPPSAACSLVYISKDLGFEVRHNNSFLDRCYVVFQNTFLWLTLHNRKLSRCL